MTQDAREKLADKFAKRLAQSAVQEGSMRTGFLAGYAARDTYIAQLEKVAEAATKVTDWATFKDVNQNHPVEFLRTALDALKKGEAHG